MGAGGSGMSPHGMSRAVRWWLACLGLIAAIASASPASDQQQTTAPALASLTSSTPQQLERQGDELRAQKRFLDSIDYYNAAIAQQPPAFSHPQEGSAEVLPGSPEDRQELCGSLEQPGLRRAVAEELR